MRICIYYLFMRNINAEKLNYVLYQIVASDQVKFSVAKARFASEAGYSVSLLEKLLRGERAPKKVHQTGTLKAISKRGFEITRDELFPLASEEAS